MATFVSRSSSSSGKAPGLNGLRFALVMAGGGRGENPARLMVSLGARLGLDPVSRMAIRVPDATEPPSKFETLLGPNVRRFH